MTIPELIEILKAAEAGKVIEAKEQGAGWVVVAQNDLRALVVFLSGGYELRVKPEPREWWAVLYTQSGLQGGLWKTYEEAVAYNPEREIIRVREVLD